MSDRSFSVTVCDVPPEPIPFFVVLQVNGDEIFRYRLNSAVTDERIVDLLNGFAMQYQIPREQRLQMVEDVKRMRDERVPADPLTVPCAERSES